MRRESVVARALVSRFSFLVRSHRALPTRNEKRKTNSCATVAISVYPRSSAAN